MIIKKLKVLLMPLLVLSSLASCSWENDVDEPQVGKNNEVVFSMRIPANSALTRALDEEDEYEVRTLDVLVFEYKSDGSGKLLSRASNSGTPKISGRDLDFYVRLETKDNVTNYDFILLANGREAINYYLYENDLLKVGISKAEVQETLKSGIPTGYGWITDKTSPAYKPMPMWGELTNQTIEAGKTYNRTTLLRATVKIDIEVELDNADDNFELEEVRYYNYTTQGYVIPLPKNLENGKAKEPTIDGLTLNSANPITYASDVISTDKKSLKNSIYGFEGPKGSMDNDKYMDNPCLLVKGNFNGTIGWYRLDFANVNPNDQTSTYLALLRNHSYNMKITAVNGPGFPEPGEALNSKPVNVVTNVTQWDGEDLSGIWNGNYEIKFTSLDAHFTQFGEPSQYEVTITTNCPLLKFEDFANISKGNADTDWVESPAGTWRNNHFVVKIVKGATIGDRTTYSMTITANKTGENDPKRETRFKIKGNNMEATFRITQDQHILWRLMADPDPMIPIMIDGAAQRIPLNITSTHPYSIDLNSSGGSVFSGVYDAPAGGNQLSLTNIPATITTVYVQAGSYASMAPRVGTLEIKHANTNSEAPPLTFNVIQVTAVISAIIPGEGYETTVPVNGGNVKINVTSNMSEWVPVLKRKIGSNSEQTLSSSSDLLKYLGITKGSGSSEVTFTAPAITGDDDHVYSLTFKDANGTTESSPKIVITQVAKLPGAGGGGIPPSRGVRGQENILCVDEKGILNLDGRGHIVYFKWGSTIAISGAPSASLLHRENIAWTPIEFDYDALFKKIGDYTDWVALAMIPHQDTGYVIVDDPVAGTGDPCKLAVKNNTMGTYRMPTRDYYEQNPSMGSWSTVNGFPGRYNSFGSQFYPAAGDWGISGKMHDVRTHGLYWSSSTDNIQYGVNFNFNSTNIYPMRRNSDRGEALTIRCVPN